MTVLMRPKSPAQFQRRDRQDGRDLRRVIIGGVVDGLLRNQPPQQRVECLARTFGAVVDLEHVARVEAQSVSECVRVRGHRRVGCAERLQARGPLQAVGVATRLGQIGDQVPQVVRMVPVVGMRQPFRLQVRVIDPGGGDEGVVSLLIVAHAVVDMPRHVHHVAGARRERRQPYGTVEGPRRRRARFQRVNPVVVGGSRVRMCPAQVRQKLLRVDLLRIRQPVGTDASATPSPAANSFSAGCQAAQRFVRADWSMIAGRCMARYERLRRRVATSTPTNRVAPAADCARNNLASAASPGSNTGRTQGV